MKSPMSVSTLVSLNPRQVRADVPAELLGEGLLHGRVVAFQSRVGQLSNVQAFESLVDEVGILTWVVHVQPELLGGR